jgi:hypothetical protein
VTEPRVAGDRDTVGVPGDDERAVVGAHDRGDLSESPIPGVRIFAPGQPRQFIEQR